jgi:hypothetical protein
LKSKKTLILCIGLLIFLNNSNTMQQAIRRQINRGLDLKSMLVAIYFTKLGYMIAHPEQCYDNSKYIKDFLVFLTMYNINWNDFIVD